MALTRQRWLPFTSEISPQAVCRPDPDRIDYVFKIADCADELLQAYHLLYHEYLNAGYIRESPHKLLFTTHHLLPRTTVFLAKSEKTVLSTATLVHDSREFGLPMDALYTPELAALRGQNRQVLEICSLASNRRNFSRRGIQNFTRLIFLYCVFLDIDDVCIMVNPKHVHLYKNRCEFEVFGEEKYYPRVNAPAVALRADVHAVRAKLGRMCFNYSYRYKLYSHYLTLKIALNANIFDIFKDNHSAKTQPNPLDTHLINHILADETDALSDLPLECKNLLQKSYPGIRI
jgi:hypothetical protein